MLLILYLTLGGIVVMNLVYLSVHDLTYVTKMLTSAFLKTYEKNSKIFLLERVLIYITTMLFSC